MTQTVGFEPILTTHEKSELRDEVFREQQLVGIDLCGADLRGARFERVGLERCNLTGADLRSAKFILCDLRDVLMTNAELGDNQFYGTTLRGVVGLSDEQRVAIVHQGGLFQHLHASHR